MTSVEPTTFRNVMSRLPTGVTIVTTVHSDEPLGLVIGSVVSVSLEPPLVAFFPARSSRTWQSMRSRRHVCINILGAHQAGMSHAFMRDPDVRFTGVEWERDRNGLPRLPGSAAAISARVIDIQEAGDHDYVLCHVESMHHNGDVAPLVFHGGRYTTVSDPEL